ncbi:hypothetical protein [Pelomonas sp. SE-A7]|uniref:hypothetical protein n=1 Tax=Pelomonas sp. SE-A7 TaxID=3054953 RepID=UPI00259D26DF|nr:hypothetical protein [Pelomonas sp. SE-A7]MDM4767115.1 hypothetical protein [Pelomonas sp. SE-A7]
MLLSTALCQAAGGHHAVDDAAMLGPGQCQLEAWLERGHHAYRAQHLGPACHVQGLELGLNLDRLARAGDTALRSAGLQLKWARELQPGLGWGLVWGTTWQSASPRHAGQSLLLPVSWTPLEQLTIHLNVGRDFHARAPDHDRHGVALEWQPLPRWQGLLERWHDGVSLHHRFGLRHTVSEAWSIDLSRARTHAAAGAAWWSLGLNWSFDR